jgi:hypothetical protein
MVTPCRSFSVSYGSDLREFGRNTKFVFDANNMV